MSCKSLNGPSKIRAARHPFGSSCSTRFPGKRLENHGVINLLTTLFLVVGLFAAETTAGNDPLKTDTRVDYTRMKSGFANPPQEGKLRCFWFWQYGLATKQSITRDLEAMQAKGYGGALLGDNGGPEGSAFYVFRRASERRHVTRITRDGRALVEGNAPLRLNASGIFVHGKGTDIIREGAYELTWSDGTRQKLNGTALPMEQVFKGPWKITFMERPCLGEPFSVETDALKSWTEFSRHEIKYFSGTARYTKTFNAPARPAKQRTYLDLGNVQDLVTVRLNGKVVDTCWIAPFRVDITDHLVQGRNLLELDITNCWPNRLIGDGKLPPAQRKTRSNVLKYGAGKFQQPGSDKLLRISGLLGPVRLQFGQSLPSSP